MKAVVTFFSLLLSAVALGQTNGEDHYFHMTANEEDQNIPQDKSVLKLTLNQEGATVFSRTKHEAVWTEWDTLSQKAGLITIDTLKSTEYNFKMELDGYETIYAHYVLESQHYYEASVHFYPQQLNIVVPAKPAIYIYSDNPKSFNVTVNPVGEFGYTFPIHNKGGWDIIVDENGLSCNGKAYDYLFWDSRQEQLDFDYNVGFVFKGTETAVFLESKLKEIGLNDRESQDFIAYWGPKLSSNNYNYVQFLLDHDCEEAIGSLYTSIPMDSQLRVFMVYKPLKAPVPVLEQELPQFNRKGLTLVEWGGGEIFNNQVGL